MKTDSIKKNFVFQTAYQLIVFLIPLIVAPYLTRTLGSEGLGTYTYVNTFVTYVGLIANLGIATYGQRLIASKRDDPVLLGKAFWSLYSLHVLASVIAIVLYFFLSVFIVREHNELFLVQGIFVAAALFDVTWLFYGLENFKSVVVKNGLVKVIECLLIFALIKERGDLNKYALIMSCSALLGQIIMIPQAVRMVPPAGFSVKELTGHIKPLLLLFGSVVAVTLYTVFDKTLIGALTTKADVAIYEYSARIIEIPKQILNVIGMVILPRACNAFASGKFDEQKKYMDISVFLTCFLGSAFMFGLLAVSDKFSLIYYGEEFGECGRAIAAMTPLILIVLIGNVFRTEYIIPAGLDKQLTLCHVISSALNIVLSFALIPVWGIYGAIIGTICAEMFGLIYQMYYSRKLYTARAVFKNLIPFLGIGLVMLLILKCIDARLDNSIMSLLWEVLIGAGIYLAASAVCIRHLYPDKWKLFSGMVSGKKG